MFRLVTHPADHELRSSGRPFTMISMKRLALLILPIAAVAGIAGCSSSATSPEPPAATPTAASVAETAPDGCKGAAQLLSRAVSNYRDAITAEVDAYNGLVNGVADSGLASAKLASSKQKAAETLASEAAGFGCDTSRTSPACATAVTGLNAALAAEKKALGTQAEAISKALDGDWASATALISAAGYSAAAVQGDNAQTSVPACTA